jgi:hypothetical protein
MAKKNKPHWRAVQALRCPTNLKSDAKKPGLCFRTERVQRDGHKGYITSFFSRSSGRSAGFSAAPGACKRTMDPFQASIRTKGRAEEIGVQCALQDLRKKGKK